MIHSILILFLMLAPTNIAGASPMITALSNRSYQNTASPVAIGAKIDDATNSQAHGLQTQGKPINSMIQVMNESALTSLSTATIDAFTAVHREGYYVAGDGGEANYLLSSSPCSLNSGSGDGGSQVSAPGGACWIASFPTGEVNVKVWGARFDDSSDDSVALQAGINWAVTNSHSLVLPCGTSLFNTPLKATGGTNNWTLRGTDGGVCSSLVYNGTNTTNDIFTVGNIGLSDASYGVTITGFRLDSHTQMTAGDALHLWHLKQSRVDPTISGQSGNGMFYNGIHYDEVDIVRTPNAYIYGAANDNVLVNGSKSTEPWYANYVGEVRLGQGKIAPSDPQLNRGGSRQYSQTGVHIAGSVGGFSAEAVDIIANHHDVVVDNSVTSIQNQTILLGPGTYTDSSIGDNIVLNDTGNTSISGFGGTKRFFDYGWNACGGCASGAGNGITIRNFTNGTVVLAGYAIQGNQGYGVYDEDTSTTITISPSEVFSNNTSANIGSSITAMKIASNNPTILNGTAYDANSLTSTLPLYGGPYSFTPRLRFGETEIGISYISNDGKYTLDGMIVNCDFNFTLSSIGSATGNATIANLPAGQNANLALGGGGTLNYASRLTKLSGAIALSMDSGGRAFTNIYQWNSSGTSILTNGNFTSNSSIRGRVSFIRR